MQASVPPRIFLELQGNAKVWSRDAWASLRASKSSKSTAPAITPGCHKPSAHLSDAGLRHHATSAPPCRFQPRDSLSGGRRKCYPLESTAWRQSWNILLVSTAEIIPSCSLIQTAYILTVPLKLIFPSLTHKQTGRLSSLYAFSC